MGDITGFAALRPGAFKDKLNSLMAINKKDYKKAIEKFKAELCDYVKELGEHMTEKSVEFEIRGGKVKAQYYGRGEPNMIPICDVADLPAIKEKFQGEGFTLEWAYDRGKLNGKLVFRW